VNDEQTPRQDAASGSAADSDTRDCGGRCGPDDAAAPRPYGAATDAPDDTTTAAPAVDPAGAAPPDGPFSAVTWGWLSAIGGLLVAIAPVVLLTLLSLATGTDSSGRPAADPTSGEAFATVAITVVIDAWYLLAAWFFSLRRSGARLDAWGFRRPRTTIFWAVPLALVIVYAVSIVYNLNVDTKEQVIVESFPRNAAGVVLFLLLACVVAPLFEETFFRGFLFQGFARSWGWILGAVASAAVFSLSHQQLDIFVPLFALGLALAWVYYVTRSVWGSIALHAVYNGIAVVAWLAGA
jgi:membrane protease YdiL (CAAX protease family)